MLAQTQFPVLHMEVQQKGDGSFIVQWGKGESKRKLVIFPSHAPNMAKNSYFGVEARSIVFRSM